MSQRKHLDAAAIAVVEAALHDACGFQAAGRVKSTLELAFFRACDAAQLEPDVFLKKVSAREAKALETLVENSVVGETYFSRHPEHFAALRSRILPALKDVPKLKVWSAGCATGEETYDLAAALLESGRTPNSNLVLGTDISERALEKARAGRYTRWSLRSKTAALQRWAEPTDGGLHIKPRLRESVTFRRSNLIADPAPMSGCHIIFCRNVLIYFKVENIVRVLHKFSEALEEGGWLVLGAAELPNATAIPLEWVDSEGVTLLRKPAAGTVLPMHGRPAAKAVNPARPQQNVRKAPKSPSRKLAVAPTWVDAPTPETKPETLFEQSREAARRGALEEAEALAKESGEKELRPEAFLILALVAESRGDLDLAVAAIKRGLFLDANLVMGHATLVSLYHRLGKHNDAERARRNALRALEDLGEGAIVPGIEAITAAALRRALQNS